MTASRIIEPIDVFEDGHLQFAPCLSGIPPDQFSLDQLEEGLDGGDHAVALVPSLEGGEETHPQIETVEGEIGQNRYAKKNPMQQSPIR